jgi:ADP-heptose:LPS heptosyltransferase
MPCAQILVFHQGAIGDLVLSLPALQTIKNSFPGRAIEMLGYPGILSLIKGNFADAIRTADWAPASTLYGDFADMSEQMRQYLAGFERLFVFSASEKNAFVENLQRCHPAAVHITTFPDTSQHVIDYQLEQLAALGFAPAGCLPQLVVSPDDRSRAGEFLRCNDFDMTAGPLIAVHAGSGGRHKCWPLASFFAVMQGLYVQRQASFLIIQGPAEEKTAGEITAAVSALPCLALRNVDLPLVAALISRSALCIGNDSGITHIAAALGIPTVAVFGPTDPVVWGPRGQSVCIVKEYGDGGQCHWPRPDVVLQRALSLLGG